MAEAQRASTIEGQIMRVADLIAYVNHDIDDATRAGLLRAEDLPREAVAVLGESSSARIGDARQGRGDRDAGRRVVRDSDERPVLDAVLELRAFLFDGRLREQRGDRRIPEGDRHPRAGSGRRSGSGLPSFSSRARSSRRASTSPPAISSRA